MVNEKDNCPLVPNPKQEDSDKNRKGDICQLDDDGDGINNDDDVCPYNNNIERTDFRHIQSIAMGENTFGQKQPIWQFKDEGKEILQEINSAPGMAIGRSKLGGFDLEATIHVGKQTMDNDWIGIVFAFQVKCSIMGK